MMRAPVAVAALFLAATTAAPAPVSAETAIAARAIPARQVISADDIAKGFATVPGAATLEAALGMEARVTIFKGQPVLLASLTEPASIERNQLVRLVFSARGITIETEGRALDRAAPGGRVRVLNTGSRSVVVGFVRPDGAVEISNPN